MGASFSKLRKRKASESVDHPPTPPKKFKVAAAVDDYQVFLSFRGADTRNDFTDVLYEHMDRVGIRVFRDEDEIPMGEQIDIILQAIENSEVCVPILSESFASSAWCLREVEKMVELDKKVIPIFYKVTPYDVKLKTDLYKKDLANHEVKHGKNQVDKWRSALKKIGKIKGKEIFASTSYTEFCKKFVDHVLGVLQPRKRFDTDHLVGMDDQIEGVMKLLDTRSNDDSRYLVIHGMSGIGKTTLANVIYDKVSRQFDNACFLEDVRESFCRGNGFGDLKNLLLDRLDPKSVGRTNLSRDIRERFHKRKVLIVLDDVDKWEQVEKLAGKANWFGAGSRKIITTRNKDVLNEGALSEDEVQSYEMKTLDHQKAGALFCWYAFRNHTPSVGFESFTSEIVGGAGGLPLTLKVTGALLYKKDENAWSDVTSRLKRTPFKEVAERLRISYDALEDDQKKIFLDIACLSSVGKEKAKAVYMWGACDFYPHWGLEVLRSMSLVKYVAEDEIWMHDQLKDLGRKIVREESGDPTKRSRLWEHKEALQVLMSIEGKEKVEALSLENAIQVALSSEHFTNFRELRFLKLAGANISGDFENLLPNLRWLSWNYCPAILNVTNLYMKNLVVLDLSFSFISESWGGWSLIQILNNLKVLDISNCHNLTRTPDFSDTNRLERLDLHHCSELREIHSSIGKLQRLKYLNLKSCYSLDGLPNEIGGLLNLEHLRVSGSRRCRGNFKLPRAIGLLESLSVLELGDLGIVDIPDSIGDLTKLEVMSLKGCSRIKQLPESLGNLESLSELNLSYVGISEFPNSIGGLVKLKILHLIGCSNLEMLPETFGGLQELKLLTLENCKIRKFPISIGMLKNLEGISYCSSDNMLEELPMEIGSLSSLRKLRLDGSCMSTLPLTVSQLPVLEELHFFGNDQIEELPDLPLSLKSLRILSRSLQRTPDFSRLTNLMELRLLNIDDYRWPQQVQNYSKFEGLEKLTKLRRLALGVANATALQFDLASLSLLDSLSLDFQPHLAPASSSHDSLNISQEIRLEGLKLPDLSGLKNLSDLSFMNCFLKDGLDKLGIQQLANLTTIVMANCGFELIQLCLLNNLRSLHIWHCGSLKALPNLSKLKNLDSLYIVNCKEVVEIPGLGNLEALASLSIGDCESLERLESLSKLEKLSNVILGNCPKLGLIEGTEGLFFSNLSVDNCTSLPNIDELKKKAKRGSINGLEFENFG